MAWEVGCAAYLGRVSVGNCGAILHEWGSATKVTGRSTGVIETTGGGAGAQLMRSSGALAHHTPLGQRSDGCLAALSCVSRFPSYGPRSFSSQAFAQTHTHTAVPSINVNLYTLRAKHFPERHADAAYSSLLHHSLDPFLSPPAPSSSAFSSPSTSGGLILRIGASLHCRSLSALALGSGFHSS